LNTLVFDIETVPDTALGRRLHDVADLDDEAVAKIMFFKQRQARNTDFLPIPQHKIVAISVVLRTRDDLHVYSLGDPTSDERELVERFFGGLERYAPELVSWNGGGFDLPVLHYRSLHYGIAAERYWEIGDRDRDYRYNNYLSRFHWRHLDLMDVLAGFQPGGRSSLEQTALLLGQPGKLGMSGAKVWDRYREGAIDAIRNYCETDVLNTYLIYLRFQLIRGIFDLSRYAEEIKRLEHKLESLAQPHLTEFLTAWRSTRYEP
jgi:predicted PolB exonuclease-like 3'-5' exonuclease